MLWDGGGGVGCAYVKKVVKTNKRFLHKGNFIFSLHNEMRWEGMPLMEMGVGTLLDVREFPR